MSESTELRTSSEITGLVPLAGKLANAIGLLRGGTTSANSLTNSLGLPRRTAIGLAEVPRDLPDLDRVDSWPAQLRSLLGAARWADYTPNDGHGWDGEIIEYGVVKNAVVTDEDAALARQYWAAYRDTCAPLDTESTVVELTKLRTKCAKRPESDADWQVTLEALLDELEPYPADLVVWALREWSAENQWWPTWKELREKLDRRVRRRRGMMASLEQIGRTETIEQISKRVERQYLAHHPERRADAIYQHEWAAE